MSNIHNPLPAEHGVTRAAARIHNVIHPAQSWSTVTEGSRQQYREAVTNVLRDLAPDPRVVLDLPLLWYSPSWGVCVAERADWMKGGRNVVALRQELVIALPDDALPLTPIQPTRPGRSSLDDMRARPAYGRPAA